MTNKKKKARKMRSPLEAVIGRGLYLSNAYQIQVIQRRLKELKRGKNSNPDAIKRHEEILAGFNKR